jgi:serine protease inhibitor
MQEISISVSSEAAIAYESASQEKRKQIQEIVNLLLQKQAEDQLSGLREIMDELSSRAIARGLTPEILESILMENVI